MRDKLASAKPDERAGSCRSHGNERGWRGYSETVTRTPRSPDAASTRIKATRTARVYFRASCVCFSYKNTIVNVPDTIMLS